MTSDTCVWISLFVSYALQIWSPLIEKAFAVHAGGWDQIEGGYTAVGLTCLTGCTETFVVRNNAKTLDPETYQYRMIYYDWSTFTANSAQKGRGDAYLKKGGFIGGEDTVGPDALFDNICEWDQAGYICCAGTGGRPGGTGNHDNDNEGIADGHVSSLPAPPFLALRLLL